MTNDSLEAGGKLFKLYVVNCIYPLKDLENLLNVTF